VSSSGTYTVVSLVCSDGSRVTVSSNVTEGLPSSFSVDEPSTWIASR
jgi:hypothetical protein